MDTIGEILKNARLKRGLTIDELQKITKIQRRYLQAIESNDFNALPSDFYARTFVRQFAEAVGVNPRPLIKRLTGESDTEDLSDLVPDIPVQGSRKEKYNQPNSKGAIVRNYIPIALLTLVVIAIISAVIYAIRLDNEQGPVVPKPDKTTILGSGPKEVTASSEDDTETSKTEDSTDSDKKESKKKKEPKETFVFESDAEGVVTFKGSDVERPVKIDFKGLEGPAWIGLQRSDTGEMFYQYTLQPDESLESYLPEDVSDFYIVVGAAPNLTIHINGQEIPFNEKNPSTGKKNILIKLDEDNTPSEELDETPNE